MNKFEARLVRGRLGEYTILQAMAAEADKQALLTQFEIDEAGRPRSPVLDPNKVPTQNHMDTSSLINDLISDQQRYERDSKRFNHRMQLIENFITENVPEEKLSLFVARFIEGQSYEQMVPDFARSITGIQSIFDRELCRIDIDKAKDLLS